VDEPAPDNPVNTLRMKLLLAFAAMLVWSLGHAATPSGRICNPATGTQKNPSLPPNTCFEYNISYGIDPLQNFNVYMPPAAKGAKVILMVHGGGWSEGDKADTDVVQNKVKLWVPAGYIFISMNYPLVPQVNPVQQAQSVALALVYAQLHATDWGGDPRKFILMGFSAGGNLVSQLAAEPSLATSLGAQPWLGTVSLDGAAFDVPEIMYTQHLSVYDLAFGTSAALWNSASPTLQVSTRIAPFFAACSTQDTLTCAQAQEFVNKVKSYGTTATILQVDLSHEQMNADLGLPSTYTSQVNSFISSLNYLMPPPRAAGAAGKSGGGAAIAPGWPKPQRLPNAGFGSRQPFLGNWRRSTTLPPRPYVSPPARLAPLGGSSSQGIQIRPRTPYEL
jgi:arylformamidase